MSQPHLDEHAHSPFSLDVWKRMLPHALVYRAHLIWMGVAGIFLALLDTLFPWMTGKMIDEVTKVGLSQSLRQYGIGYAVMVVMFALSVWVLHLARREDHHRDRLRLTRQGVPQVPGVVLLLLRQTFDRLVTFEVNIGL